MTLSGGYNQAGKDNLIDRCLIISRFIIETGQGKCIVNHSAFLRPHGWKAGVKTECERRTFIHLKESIIFYKLIK